MLDKSANQTVTLKQAQGIIFINGIQMLKLGYWHYKFNWFYIKNLKQEWLLAF